MPASSDSSDPVVVVVTRSVVDTNALAGRLAAVLRPGDVVLLDGPLGAGKTTMVRAIAAELGVQVPVTSPTYTLVHEYAGSGGVTVVHLDLYRLETLAEVEDLGIGDLIGTEAIVLVEWGSAAGPVFGPDRLEVDMAYGPPDVESERQVRLRPVGPRWRGRLGPLEAR